MGKRGTAENVLMYCIVMPALPFSAKCWRVCIPVTATLLILKFCINNTAIT